MNKLHISTSDKGLRRTAIKSAITGFCLTAVAMGSIQLNAQAIGSHNSKAPVEYAADRIELQDRQNRVMLTGNVVITQAELTVRSTRTLVNYSNGDGLSIERITATGGVTVTRGRESARGDVAVYDFNRRIITMAGNVRLNRNGDTLNGGRLVIDLASGVSSVDGRAAGSSPVSGEGSESSTGRVSGRFSVPKD